MSRDFDLRCNLPGPRKGVLKKMVALLSLSFRLLPVWENILSRKGIMTLSIRDRGK